MEPYTVCSTARFQIFFAAFLSIKGCGAYLLICMPAGALLYISQCPHAASSRQAKWATYNSTEWYIGLPDQRTGSAAAIRWSRRCLRQGHSSVHLYSAQRIFVAAPRRAHVRLALRTILRVVVLGKAINLVRVRALPWGSRPERQTSSEATALGGKDH